MAPGSGGPAGPVPSEKKPEKSYLANAVDNFSPWSGSRSTTPTPKDPLPSPLPTPTTDHSINPLYGQTFRRYPVDCPPLEVMWFHAVDVPKRKPKFLRSKKTPEPTKPNPPKKFVAFSVDDSRSLENAYQKLLGEVEDAKGGSSARRPFRSSSLRNREQSYTDTANTSIDEESVGKSGGVRVPVNEDFLFDVDIEERELAPAYWLGPVYDVRRGTWFYQEGSTLRPCEENLAAQLEAGYLKTKPWTLPVGRSRSNSSYQPQTPTSNPSMDIPKSAYTVTGGTVKQTATPPSISAPSQPQTYRLFGTYMNSVVTFQDANTAWLNSEGMLSWVTSTVYQRWSGSGFMSGVKLVRGYTDPKTKEDKRPETPTTATMPPPMAEDNEQKVLKRRSAPPSVRSEVKDEKDGDDQLKIEAERRENRLRRQFSSYIENSEDPDKEEESIRKREEQEIQDDYNAQAGETQGREIEHLILVTHGIGQQLGLRMEAVNFVHDVNMLRKTMKGVYAQSADLKALNSEEGDGPGNCRVQVLPVVWRHLLDFPKRREKRAEHDLGDLSGELAADSEEYPSLEDITIEGVAFARSLISDLALDVLLYQSAYREQISEIVLEESNRIFKLFKERNPEFKGKVHIIGHSLGSAIMFDILCRQKEPSQIPEPLRSPIRKWPLKDKQETTREQQELSFKFDVQDFYCLGSPVGLFQMLKGRTIAARQLPNSAPSESPLIPDYVDGPFPPAQNPMQSRVSPITGLPFTISSPKISQLFNIFHPSDPIAYRLEPLISPAMSSLKPQALPYTKKGIFNSVTPAGLSGIGVKVGQSVSGLFSSIGAGITSSILNRSLGFTNEDVARLNASANPTPTSTPPATDLSPGAGTNIVAGGVISDTSAQSLKTDARKRALARQNTSGSLKTTGINEGGDGSNDATLIDDDLETLYARFQQKRVENQGDGSVSVNTEDGTPLGEAWAAEERKAQKLRREEQKVRALNCNGRVDYNIQESVLDFNPMNTIASHMSYWADEDVSHFVMSQLLSHRGLRKTDKT